jgi:hypothetical protein
MFALILNCMSIIITPKLWLDPWLYLHNYNTQTVYVWLDPWLYLCNYNTQAVYVCLDGDYALDYVFWWHISTATQFESVRYCKQEQKMLQKKP